MSLFSDNIRSLRIKKDQSQEKIASELGITRSRYAKYESGLAEPPYDLLRKISLYWHISIDLLLSVDMRKIRMEELLKLDDNRILLPIAVDAQGNNTIELVTHKARAGYLTGYADPEFIEKLPLIDLPFLGPGKHRAFPIDGDSMPPHNNSAFIVGKYVENLGEVRYGKTYILVTRNDGITYKRLMKKDDEALTVQSDNIAYTPYEVKLSDIYQIWEFACSINTREAEPDDWGNLNVKEVLMGLRREIGELKRKA